MLLLTAIVVLVWKMWKDLIGIICKSYHKHSIKILLVYQPPKMVQNAPEESSLSHLHFQKFSLLEGAQLPLPHPPRLGPTTLVPMDTPVRHYKWIFQSLSFILRIRLDCPIYESIFVFFLAASGAKLLRKEEWQLWDKLLWEFWLFGRLKPIQAGDIMSPLYSYMKKTILKTTITYG